ARFFSFPSAAVGSSINRPSERHFKPRKTRKTRKRGKNVPIRSERFLFVFFVSFVVLIFSPRFMVPMRECFFVEAFQEPKRRTSAASGLDETVRQSVALPSPGWWL